MGAGIVEYWLVSKKVLQVLATEFVLLAVDFVPLANEFVLLANEFIPLWLARKFILNKIGSWSKHKNKM